MNSPAPAAGDTLRRALTTVEQLQRRVEELEARTCEPIAVVGASCRFPGGVRGMASYWDLLADGRDGVVAVPPQRWDIEEFYDERPQTPGRVSSRWGGFLDHVDRFDHEFFSISHREAVLMDPQHRIFLETAWEAIEDAGIAPPSLAGSATGVHLALYGVEYAHQVFADIDRITAYSTLGNLHSIAAGRLSYLLDLRGPSVAVDTACSSSLVAVHQACQSLRLGETELAVCGAVNLLLSPESSISLSQLHESFVGDGRIKAFDAAADGFVRSEGCGVVVLKRLSDARRDGDAVRAVIRGSAVNQDGRGAGLTAPNGTAQREVVRQALRAAGMPASRVGLVETHGTGTRLGDPIEADALVDVYGRPNGPAVHLGAVKTNLGHLEAAAGMAGLLKAVLCVEHGLVTPNLHFSELSPHISFEGTTFVVPTALTPWPQGPHPRVAAVSSFGLSGTNAHVVIEQAAPTAVPTERAEQPSHLLVLSAKSSTALVKLARRYQDLLRDDDVDLAGVCHTAAVGRAHQPFRLAVHGATRQAVAEGLGDVVRGEPNPAVVWGHTAAPGATDVVCLFSGAGAQRPGMAAELYRTLPAFRRVVDQCEEILRDRCGISVLPALTCDARQDGADAVDVAAPALFAVEYALAETWRTWGLEPVAVLGHSLGEYVAATFAGVMSLEDGLVVVTERARLLEALPDDGAVVVVSAPWEEVAAELTLHDASQVGVAAVNGPAHVTVSGRRDVVAAVADALRGRGVAVTDVRVGRPGHSPLVEPVLGPLRDLLAGIEMSAPRVPLVSGVTGRTLPWDRVPDPEHWCRHTRQPVLFADGVATLLGQGARTFLEVGPGTDLLGMALANVRPDDDVLMAPSLRPGRGDWDVLMSSLGRLHVRGVPIDWAAVGADGPRRRVRLPSYPFDPVRCWHDVEPTPTARPAVGRGDDADDDAPVAGPSVVAGPRLATAQELLALPPDARVDALVGQLTGTVRHALGYRGDPPDPDEPLSGLGLDSLMAVELRNEIQVRLGVPLAVAGFLAGATVRSVAETVVAQLPGADGTGTGASTAIGRAQRVGPGDDLDALLALVEAMPDAAAGAQADVTDEGVGA